MNPAERVKTVAEQVGWEEWKAGRTSNAIKLWAISNIKIEDLLNLINRLREAHKVIALTERLAGGFFSLSKVLSEENEVREIIYTYYPNPDEFMDPYNSFRCYEMLLQHLTYLPGGRINGNNPSTKLYEDLICELILMAVAKSK